MSVMNSSTWTLPQPDSQLELPLASANHCAASPIGYYPGPFSAGPIKSCWTVTAGFSDQLVDHGLHLDTSPALPPASKEPLQGCSTMLGIRPLTETPSRSPDLSVAPSLSVDPRLPSSYTTTRLPALHHCVMLCETETLVIVRNAEP